MRILISFLVTIALASPSKLSSQDIKPEDIAWVSLGTFRFSPALKPIIEHRFPDNKILDEELVIGYDGKLRYPDELRERIYRTISGQIRKHHPKAPLYLCMEDKGVYSSTFSRDICIVL